MNNKQETRESSDTEGAVPQNWRSQLDKSSPWNQGGSRNFCRINELKCSLEAELLQQQCRERLGLDLETSLPPVELLK